MSSRLKYLIIALTAVLALSCSTEEQDAYIPRPALNMTITEVTDTSVIVSVLKVNSEKAYIYCTDSDTDISDAEHIVVNGEETFSTSLTIDGLSPETGYTIYGVSADQEMNLSSVSMMTFMTEKAKTPEGQQKVIPTYADMVLIPGGYSSRKPDTWPEERLEKYVIYTDTDGKEHWLHESYLFVFTNKSSDGRIMRISPGGEKSADKKAWGELLDYWFKDGVVKALDNVVGDAMTRIGTPPFKPSVVIGIPDPIRYEIFIDPSSSTVYWGEIDGVLMDFSKISHQIKAYKWMVDQVILRWKAASPKNISLGGFYILSEELVAKPSGWNYGAKQWDKILPSVSSYIHEKGCGLHWIPYYLADGHDMTEQLGIDMAYMQPNKYWTFGDDNSWNMVYSAMRTYGLGMELEFEGTHAEGNVPCTSILEKLTDGKDNPQAAEQKRRFREYLDGFKSAGFYGKVPVATYSGTNSMYELATSTEPEDVEMYNEYCRFIIDSPLRKR